MSQSSVIADLSARKTVKLYDSAKRIPADQIAEIYEALRLSPSSINSQPWKFIVIESENAKERLETTFANKFQVNQKHAKDASHIILFAYNPSYKRSDFDKVVDQDILNGRTKEEEREAAMGKFLFAELNTDESGDTSAWCKAQTYLALGNILHVVARMGIDATPMEGVDAELIAEEFASELDGYVCEVGLALGYHHVDDFNQALPKSRLPLEEVVTVI